MSKKLKLLFFSFFIFSIFYGVPLVFAVSEEDARQIEGEDRGAWPESEEKPQGSEKAPPEVLPNEKKTLKLNPNIRAIEAEEFPVKITKKSTTGKVFLIEDLRNNEPRPGKILLLKKGEEDIAAVRVLKNRPGRFIAKIVLKLNEIETNVEYRALKKLGDKIMEQIAPKEKPQNLDESIRDVELAKEIDANDVELDRGIQAPQKKKKKKKNDVEPDLNALEVSEDELADYSVDFSKTEEMELEPYNHSLSMQIAFHRNGTLDKGTTYYTALALRYGYTFARKMIFTKGILQDYLTLEFGTMLYKISGYQVVSDELTVVPFLGNFRYNVLVHPFFSTFLYAGLSKANVYINQGSVEASALRNLTEVRPMIGVGFLLKLGPGWSVRGDAGLDMFAFGGVLKF